MMMDQYLLVVFLAVTVSAEEARFDNYQVYRVIPETYGQLEILRSLENESYGLSFWSSPSIVNASVDIMVPPHKIPDFMDILKYSSIQCKLYVEDVQEVIENVQPTTRLSSHDWTSYHRLEEINDWLDTLVVDYPGIVSSIIGGSSYEGRQINGVKVSYKSGNPGVFIEGGIHAREWIAPATVTYILHELLISDDPDVREVAENYDWYIFPIVNPDGYEYSHTTNRIWRKTRSQSSYMCYGADINRNWGFHWMDGGANKNPCSETYAGSAPFSEIETKTLSEYIASISSNIQVYLTFHSYSQMLLIPYGFTNERVSNYNTLMAIGEKARTALSRQYGTQYKLGNIVDTIYVASGCSMDWVRGVLDILITYTFELRDTGRYGFLLPANQIIPTGKETLDAVVTILQETRSVIRERL